MILICRTRDCLWQRINSERHPHLSKQMSERGTKIGTDEIVADNFIIPFLVLAQFYAPASVWQPTIQEEK